LDVERAAIVEITSEDKNFPIEAAFASGAGRGWHERRRGVRQFVSFSISRRGLAEFRWSLREPNPRAPKNSSCAGRGMVGAHLPTSCASSGIFSLPGSIREAEEHKLQLSGITSRQPSQDHRIVIALLSPHGVVQTGLLTCPPEKTAAKAGPGIDKDPFSSPV